jgi:hypothetical protein
MIRSLKTLASLVCLVITALLTSGAVSGVDAQSPVSEGSDTSPTVTVSSICGKNSTYDSITTDASKPSAQKISFGTAPVELTITSTEVDERPVNSKQASTPDFCFWHVLWFGVNVSTVGEVSSFADGEGASRGGGGGKLDPEAFARLEELMVHLPDDGHRLPEFGNRIMVRVERGENVTVRVYDRAHLPDEILEMIRLTGARVKVVTPVFKPDDVWTGDEAESLGLGIERTRGRNANAFSPDKSIGVVHDFVTKTLTVYKVTPSSANGWPQDKNDILRVIDEFWQPPVYGGYWVNTEFSPDGRWLLVTWGNRIGALLYDTSTWEPVNDLHLFPQSLKEYLPSPDWDLGVAVTDAGEALIWDQQSHRILSKLPALGEFEPAPTIHDRNGNRVYDTPSAEIRFAAFSPDEKRVAIYSGPDNVYKLRLTVWDVASGKMLREFWPIASSGSFSTTYISGKPTWWNDGRWLLAGYSTGAGYGLWDAQTGQFLGTFDAAGCRQAADSVVSAGDKLFQQCVVPRGEKGGALQWSVESVKQQIVSWQSAQGPP